MIVHAISTQATSLDVARDLADVLGSGSSDYTVHVHRLDLPDDAAPTDLIAAGHRLAERIGGGDAPQLVHALDPRSWVPATVAGQVRSLPLALRVADADLPGETPLPALMVACLRHADAVGVSSTGTRAAVMAHGVRGDRVQVLPDPVVPLAGPLVPTSRDGTVLLLEDAPASGWADRMRDLIPAARVADPDGVGGWADRIDDAALVVSAPTAVRGAVRAMWRGRAVVSHRSAVMDDVVVDRQTGVLVDGRTPQALAREARRMLMSPFLLQSRGLAGRRRAESRYAAAQLAAATEGLYLTAARLGRVART